MKYIGQVSLITATMYAGISINNTCEMEQLRLSLDSPSDVAGKLHYQKTPRAKPLYCMRAKHIVSTIVVFICIHVSF